LSFTNQRLFSPNPTAIRRACRTIKQLLGVSTMLTLDPVRDDAGAVVRDERRRAGVSLAAGATRGTTRTGRIWQGSGNGSVFPLFARDDRTYVMARDVVFMKAMRQHFHVRAGRRPGAGALWPWAWRL
jgi:hypothetical protein